MFDLWGDIARMYGSIISKVVMTLSWVETVATPVSVIMWTCGGIKLPTSPNLENFFLKNGKKNQNMYITAYTVILKTKLELHVFQVLISRYMPTNHLDTQSASSTAKATRFCWFTCVCSISLQYRLLMIESVRVDTLPHGCL